MLLPGDQAPSFSILKPREKASRYAAGAGGKPSLVIFIETDCPTCRLTIPYINRLAEAVDESFANILAVSQDDELATKNLVDEMSMNFPVVIDRDLGISRLFDPQTVPTIFLLDSQGRITQVEAGFDKAAINSVAAK